MRVFMLRAKRSQHRRRRPNKRRGKKMASHLQRILDLEMTRWQNTLLENISMAAFPGLSEL